MCFELFFSFLFFNFQFILFRLFLGFILEGGNGKAYQDRVCVPPLFSLAHRSYLVIFGEF